jgi:hypothetical protein
MKKLFKIELYNSVAQCRKTIVCGHIDASRHITILSESVIDVKLNVTKDIADLHDVIIAEAIDHFNIFEGMVTIYYRSGDYIEITKL